MKYVLRTVAVMSSVVLAAVAVQAADWPQFRGFDSSGVAADSNLPTVITDKDNVAWSVALRGKGFASPIISGKKVFIASSDGYRQDKLLTSCHDTETGRLLWQRQVRATGSTMTYPTMPNATPTPLCDGERVFTLYSSNDLTAYDVDGNLLWYRGLNYDYPNARNSIGMSSSLVSAGGVLVAQVEADSEAFTIGINPATGETRWKLNRPLAANWTSPAVWRGASRDKDLVILSGPSGVSLIDPVRGKEVWRFDVDCNPIPSTTAADNVLYVSAGGLTAVKPEIGKPAGEPLWAKNTLASSSASPLVLDGKVYTISRDVLNCGDIKTGELVAKLRLSPGTYWSTPVAAGGHLYCFNENGMGVVVDVRGEKPEIVSSHEFKDEIFQCTPAIADNALYMRTDNRLWKFAKTN
jgi:outer membrane protein assembly factor BamB